MTHIRRGCYRALGRIHLIDERLHVEHGTQQAEWLSMVERGKYRGVRVDPKTGKPIEVPEVRFV
jgi:hypothetical protein